MHFRFMLRIRLDHKWVKAAVLACAIPLTHSARTPYRVPYAAVVMDGDSGDVLAQHQSKTSVRPASLTKMMSIMVVLDTIQQGSLSLNSLWRVSKAASSRPPSVWGVREGTSLSVHACLMAMGVRSGNDIAWMVQENIPQCLQRMNKMAHALGMTRTHFATTSGWDTPGQKTCAYDMALLIRALWRQHPICQQFLGLPGVYRGKKWMPNTNKLQGVLPGMKISKTGFTNLAGSCLATLTQRWDPNQQRQKTVVVVVMGMPSSSARNAHVGELIETAYKAPHALENLITQPMRPNSTSRGSRTFLAGGTKRTQTIKKPLSSGMFKGLVHKALQTLHKRHHRKR